MRLALKFTLSFVLGMCVVLGVASYLRVQREIRLFEEDMQQDHRHVGQDLAGATAMVWRAYGEDAAMALIEQANASRGNIAIRLVRPDTQPGGPHAAHVPSVWNDLAGSGSDPHYYRLPHARGGYLHTYVPISLGGSEGDRAALLELSESLEDEARYVRVTVIRVIVITLIIIAFTGVMAISLGVTLVGRPVNALIEKARRVARGDLSGELRLRRSGELGELAAELNVMCKTLAEAEQRVAQESAARQLAIGRLGHAERLSTVGKLASGIAHELGTPLNVVIARAKMIAGQEVEGEAVVENARIIADQAARMTGSIQQLLDFSRRRTTERIRMDLREPARQMGSLLAPTARQRGVALALELGEEPALILADAGRIQQVLSNLLLNAIQASENGARVVVEVKNEVREWPQHSRQVPREVVCLRVRDEGVGISEAGLSRIFEPFYTTKASQGGTGLGLSITSDIVGEHDGRIDVQSRVGVGTVVDVLLPRVT